MDTEVQSSEEFINEMSEDSDSKVEELRKESQVSHINRIRFATERRNRIEFERNNYGLPKQTKKKPANIKLKNRKFQEKSIIGAKSNQLNVNDDNGSCRFMNLHLNKYSSQRNTECSGDTEEVIDNGINSQGIVHIVSSNDFLKNLNEMDNSNRKRRKQWSVTTKTPIALNVTLKENQTTVRNGEENFNPVYFSVDEIEKFNNISHERKLHPSESTERNMIARRPATEKDAAIVQWLKDMDKLPLEDVADVRNYETSVEENEESLKNESTSFPVSKDSQFTKTDEISNTCTIVNKNSKHSATKESKKRFKMARKAQMPSSKLSSENCNKFNKNKTSKRIKVSCQNESKEKINSLFKISRIRNEQLNVIVNLKYLKPEDAALLVWFGGLINPDLKIETDIQNNGRKTKSLIQFRKDYVDLGKEEMAVFTNLFKNMNKSGNEMSEGCSEYPSKKNKSEIN
ncbi:uncharacterized protein NPIL_182301 [Nephila pilipes]|uniref:Uncharacterized protein n=1 Tax=Nephila pilipes TaxID=299642 RepID=A0A8X6I244_NEPPI|nr:uncharacterized protein NPIL_182301 [Nephila pilipes]